MKMKNQSAVELGKLGGSVTSERKAAASRENGKLGGRPTRSIRFKTMADAIEAGYRPVNRMTDRDVSGGNSYGYEYESPDGERTVTVWFTDEVNRAGQKGCFLSMFPPKEAGH